MLAVSHHLKMGRVLTSRTLADMMDGLSLWIFPDENERKTVGIDQSTVHTYQPMSLVINSR
jgi:hypothetical protein